jgi:hypothetical protein
MNSRKDIKRKQHKINKVIKNMNKNIANDSLWRGRFAAHQINRITGTYDDQSGTFIFVTVLFFDKKTNRSYLRFFDYCSGNFFDYDIWKAMNDFIVEYINVWETEDRESIYNDTTDYNKIKIDWDKRSKERE